MIHNCRLLKLIITFILVTTFEYRHVTIEAIQVVNVRNSHKLQSRSLIYPPTAPTRVQFIGGVGIPVEDLSFESVTSGYVLKAEYFLPESAEVFHQKIKPQSVNRRRKSVYQTDSHKEEFDKFSLLEETDNSILSNDTSPLLKNMNIKREYNKNQQSVTNNIKTRQQNAALYRWILYKAIETVLNNRLKNNRYFKWGTQFFFLNNVISFKSAVTALKNMYSQAGEMVKYICMVLDPSTLLAAGLNGNICMLRSICEHAAVPLNYEGGLIAEIIHIILTPSASRDDLTKAEHKNYLRAEILGRSGEDCEKAFLNCTKSPMDIISAVFEV